MKQFISLEVSRSNQFDDPRGWGNAIFKEGKLWKRLNCG